MIDFKSKITVDSKAFAGVKYTIRRMSHQARARLNMANVEYRAQLRAVRDERRELDREYMEAEQKRAAEIERRKASGEAEPVAALGMDEARFMEWTRLWADEQRIDQDLLRPALVRAMFAGIEGIQIDGKTPDLEALLSEGPEELVAEIGEACAAIAELPAGDAGNWQWPVTSPGAGDGPAKSTTAPCADNQTGATT